MNEKNDIENGFNRDLRGGKDSGLICQRRVHRADSIFRLIGSALTETNLLPGGSWEQIPFKCSPI